MAFGDSFDQFQTLIREHLEPSVEDLRIQAGQDPIWDIMQTSRNVTRMGRPTGNQAGSPGYEARWNVRLQNGGLIEGATFGDTQLVKMGPDNALMMGATASSLHGDPTKAPLRSVIELKSFLKKQRGLYTINQDELESQMLSEPIEDLAAGAVEDITMLNRDIATSLFWGEGTGVMARVVNSGTLLEASTTWIEVGKGQCFRFVRGQRYVFCSMSTDTPNAVSGGTGGITPAVARCTGVNKFTRKVGFQSEPGMGSITITAGDGIVYNNMWNFTAGTSKACNGVHNLLINDGAFPDSGVTDVEHVPELQAMITGDDTSTATYVNADPELIDGVLDLVTADGQVAPPVLVAENNVWTLYNHLERRANMIVNVPQGEAFQAAGGVSGPMYTHGGRAFIIARSPKCRENTLYGLDGGSFVRYMPNDLQVRWRMANGGAAGVGNIFRPVIVGMQLSDLYVAEFDLFYQIAQTRPNANLIIKGVHSKRTYDAVNA